MANKVMIIGTGNVGASIGFSLVSQRTAVSELVLTDINMDDAEGEAMDLRDTLAVAPTQMKIHSGTYERDAGTCDIIIITAGVPQKPGETRMQLLEKNSQIFKGMIEPIMAAGFNGIFLVVSNPMDVMTYLTQKYSGLPDNQVIGSGTVLDSARLRYKIAEKLDVSPRSVHAYQVGEHGDTEFSLWSESDIGRQSLLKLLTEQERNEMEEFARHEAYDIIDKKGATYYGIGACVTKIVNAILEDTREVLPISTYDHFTDCYYGFPSVVGRQGVVRRLEIDMTEDEQVKLQKSINAIKSAIAEVPEN